MLEWPLFFLKYALFIVVLINFSLRIKQKSISHTHHTQEQNTAVLYTFLQIFSATECFCFHIYKSKRGLNKIVRATFFKHIIMLHTC
jgi:hypothetical protein